MSRKQTTAKKETEKGFSLVELLIVVGIITIMSGIAIFALRANKESYKTDDEALMVLDMLQEARFRALSQRETMRVEINLVTNQMSIIDENLPTVADDDKVIRIMKIIPESEIKISDRPSTVSISPPTPLTCPDAVFAPSLHPTSQGQRVATFRFNLMGQVQNAGVNVAPEAFKPERAYAGRSGKSYNNYGDDRGYAALEIQRHPVCQISLSVE
jgi:prepilin-type N-terminal cleavage/methylation domain-containing protein